MNARIWLVVYLTVLLVGIGVVNAATIYVPDGHPKAYRNNKSKIEKIISDLKTEKSNNK